MTSQLVRTLTKIYDTNDAVTETKYMAIYDTKHSVTKVSLPELNEFLSLLRSMRHVDLRRTRTCLLTEMVSH